MSFEQIFGCWAWDGPGERMVNVITGERLRRVEGASRRFTDTPLAHHLLVYEADDFEFPVAVSVDRLTAKERGARFEHYDVRVLDAMIYRVDLIRSARLAPSTSGRLAFGVWQRLAEFVPEAILFWPIAWPGVDDPCGGPGTKDHGRRVDVVGGWVNGKWSPGLIAEVGLPRAHEFWWEARAVLRPARFSTLAKLDAEPSSPFAMHDPRGPDKETAAEVWPDHWDFKKYVWKNGYVYCSKRDDAHRGDRDLWATEILRFPGHIPFCVSKDGARRLFLGRREAGRGHSPTLGPQLCLMTPDYAVTGWMHGVRTVELAHGLPFSRGKRTFLSSKGVSLLGLCFRCETRQEELQFSSNELDFGGVDHSELVASSGSKTRKFMSMDRMHFQEEYPMAYAYYASTRDTERRVKQDLLDAISAWGNARGGISILWDPGDGEKKLVPDALPICPFKEITLSLDPLAGTQALEKNDQYDGFHPSATVTTYRFEKRELNTIESISSYFLKKKNDKNVKNYINTIRKIGKILEEEQIERDKNSN